MHITNAFTEINKFLEQQQQLQQLQKLQKQQKQLQQHAHATTDFFFKYFEKLRETIRELLEDVTKPPSAFVDVANSEEGMNCFIFFFFKARMIKDDRSLPLFFASFSYTFCFFSFSFIQIKRCLRQDGALTRGESFKCKRTVCGHLCFSSSSTS